MLACYPRRQHNHNFDQPSSYLSSSSTSFSDYSHTDLPQASSSFYNNSIPSYPNTFSTSNQFITSSFGHSDNGPAIHLQQSTPVPQSTASYNQQSALADNLNYTQNNWEAYERIGQMITNQPLQTNFHRRRTQPHQRAPSSSSIGSSNPASPYSQSHATNLQYNYSAENSPSSKVDSTYDDDKASRSFSNHLPTPTQTPTHDAFITSSTNNYYNTQQAHNLESALAAHMALNNGIDHSASVVEDVPDISHSSRHSVSSYGQDPATPHDYYDEVKAYNNADSFRQNVPKFERTMTDAYADLGYDPTAAAIPQSVPPKQQNTTSFLSPFRSVMSERLQAAQNARSQSPASSMSGGVSPFRQGSPLAPSINTFGSPRGKLGSAAQVREQQKAETDAHALKQKMAQEQEATTISPKDVELEYQETEEDSKMPLFSEDNSEYDQRFVGGNNGYAGATPAKYESSYNNLNNSHTDNDWTSQQPSQTSYPATSTAPQSNFTFQAPAIPGGVHSLPFSSQNYRTAPPMAHHQQDETPEFPAHLTSMESSASEAAPPSSNNSTNNVDIQKPVSSLANTGTYTCTYHGCTQRFETPQKLQRHKREAHRQQPSSSPGVGSGMSSAALLARNSQAGPHKCDRINPTTGKPCSTIFSRPYDLTRHEDTIHNIRKQKVRCALCVEEKTFSRNDALTRHMRVVHPDVDFPGKHRRRGS